VFKSNTKILFLFLILLYILARIFFYGDPRLSICTNDTGTYVATAKEKISINFLTRKRPMTVPLLYKIFEPQEGYVLSAIGSPASKGVHVNKQFQAGFDRVVLSQMIVSIFSWVFLAWVFYRRLHTPETRVVSAILIFLFALSPHIAEWDSVLQSESLHISLFVLFVGMSTEFLFHLFENNSKKPVYMALVALMTVTLILWEYTRDANMYSVALIWVFLTVLMVWMYVKQKRIHPELILAGSILFVSVTTHFITLNQSSRWEKPLMSNIMNNVLPYETRTQFFVDHGMPNPETLRINLESGIRTEQYRNDPEFVDWLEKHGSKTYQKFLLDTPLWATITFIKDVESLLGWNIQPYFSVKSDFHDTLILIGNMFHSTSTLILLALGIMIIYGLINFRQSAHIIFLCMGALIFISSFMLLFISYHGDFYSQGRHAISATTFLRLDFWFIFLVTLDALALKRHPTTQTV